MLRGKSTSVVSFVGKAASGSNRFKCRMRILGNFQMENAFLHFCRVLQLAQVCEMNTNMYRYMYMYMYDGFSFKGQPDI